jgi:hypothetical protein
MVDSTLGETNFRRFMDVVLSNLVDSNVFLRSLYLSIDVYSPTEPKEWKDEIKSPSSDDGYLSHSWIQFSPEPVSKNAIELLKKTQRRNDPADERKKALKKSKIEGFRGNGGKGVSLPYTAPSSSQSLRVKNEISTPPLSSSSRISHGVRGVIQNIRYIRIYIYIYIYICM